MSTGKRRGFLGGAAILAGAVAITKLIGAVYKIPLGNLLGKEGMGPFQAAYNVYSVLLTVSTAGLPLALSRLVAEADALGRVNQRRRIFRVALGLFFVLGLIGGGLMLLLPDALAALLHNDLAAQAIRTLAPSLFCVCLLSAIRGYTQGQGRMLPTAVSQIIESSSKLIVGLSLAWVLTQRMQAPPETAAAGAILGVSAGSLLSLLTLTVWTLRSGRSEAGTDVPDGRRFILRRLLEIGIPVTLGSAGMSLVTLLDQSVSMGVLQRSLGLSVEVANGLYGEYSFALTLFALPPSFIYPVSISLVPAVSAALCRQDRAGAGRCAAAALRATALLALPAGVGLSVMAGPILHLLYPARPEEAAAAAWHLSVLGVASGTLGPGPLELPGVSLAIEVVPLPGHSSDSVGFLVEEGALVVTGDVVFAQSPTMVCWPDGRMGDYLASLDVLGRLVAERGVERLLTGHGPVIENPSERIEQARRHRLQRLQQVVSAVRSGIPADAEALVEAVYNDVRPELHDGAVRSVNAQLRYAFDEGILQENR